MQTLPPSGRRFLALGGVIKLIDLIYPIGKVESTTNEKWNPNTLFPWQTWERYAKGRTLVGVNESDSSFDTVGKTGGAKTHELTVNEMPKHYGHIEFGTGDFIGKYLSGSNMSTYGSTARGWKNYGNEAFPESNPVGGSAAHNNLQPYVAVYYWRRTA